MVSSGSINSVIHFEKQLFIKSGSFSNDKISENYVNVPILPMQRVQRIGISVKIKL